MGFIEDVKAAQARLDEATKAHAAAVKEAERLERQARKDYERRIADAERALRAEERSWDAPIASNGRLKLFATRVTGPNGALSILDGADARVDASGLGKKRKLYITIVSAAGQMVEECDAEQEKAAREFAAKVASQAKVAHEALARHEAESERLAQELDCIKRDTTAVDDASRATQAVRDDTSGIDEATRALEEVRAAGSAEDLEALKAHEQAARKKRVIAGAALAAVALVVMLFATHAICFHEWRDATCTEPETCAICGRTRGEALGHSWMEATCTKPETCERCGETTSEKLGHEVEEWKTVKKATCTSEGTREGVCVRCGKVRTRTTKMKDHEFGDWVTTKKASCTAEGESERTCANCGKKETKSIAKLEHTPGDWETVIAATVAPDGSINDGTKVRKCTVCGTELETATYTLKLTMGQRNALKTAANYLSFTAFSFDSLVDQLEFEGFSHDDAVFAVQNCGADWNEQAAKKAESYLDFMSFSREGLIDQLMFEGFSRDQAEYGVSAVGY